MNSFRKIVGALIIIFVGLPLLFAITWAVGLTRAAMSPKLVSEVPEKIIAAMPEMIDELVRDGQKPDVIRDPETRAWLLAMSKSGTSVNDLLAKTGVTAWMQGELKSALSEIGEVLKGTRPPRRITIDLRPLKKSLLDPRIGEYVIGVLNNLPACDEAGTARWLEAGREGFNRAHLPACRPADMAVAAEVVRAEQARVSGRMDDEVEIFHGVRELPFGFPHFLTFFVYGLFIIPAVFILGGALVAAASPQEFLRWSGVPILVGGLSTLGLALFIRASTTFVLGWAPFRTAHEWSSDLGPLVLDKTRWAVKIAAPEPGARHGGHCLRRGFDPDCLLLLCPVTSASRPGRSVRDARVARGILN
jgi:hypothetical protein